MINRRNLILGLTSVLAAPSIVHANNLMSIKIFDPYYTRYLVEYCIGTDELMLRVDRAQHPLPIPVRLVDQVSEEFAYRFIPRKIIESIKPDIGQQKFIQTNITCFEALQSKELWGGNSLN